MKYNGRPMPSWICTGKMVRDEKKSKWVTNIIGISKKTIAKYYNKPIFIRNIAQFDKYYSSVKKYRGKNEK